MNNGNKILIKVINIFFIISYILFNNIKFIFLFKKIILLITKLNLKLF